jgi:hypothetical protein
MTLPLRAKEYISHDPRDAIFGALPYTKTDWLDASLALPAYKAKHLITALEEALYSAHAHRHTQPSSHILILTNWQHSPYLARNLHSSYTQKLTSILYLQAQTTQKHTHNSRLDVNLVANEKALRLLNQDYITHTRHETLSNILGQNAQPITLTSTKPTPSISTAVRPIRIHTHPYPRKYTQMNPPRPAHIMEHGTQQTSSTRTDPWS